MKCGEDAALVHFVADLGRQHETRGHVHCVIDRLAARPEIHRCQADLPGCHRLDPPGARRLDGLLMGCHGQQAGIIRDPVVAAVGGDHAPEHVEPRA